MIDRNQILEEICKGLDISPSMHKLAVERYMALSRYLESKDIKANFYPQGSFKLGTVIRPIRDGEEKEYDIDLVCELEEDKLQTQPEVIKQLVGDTLKSNEMYKELLDEEGRRCWTLLYSEQNDIGFHLDILPAVHEEEALIIEIESVDAIRSEHAKSAIAITNKEDKSYTWVTSNPLGYAEWFNEINQPFYSLVEQKQKAKILQENHMIFNSIEEVPDYLIRTPMQRVIQILKRHRDIRFESHEAAKDKPISMVITTLVAQIIKNAGCLSTDVFQLLKYVVNGLDEYSKLLELGGKVELEERYQIIKRCQDGEGWYIPNPVNPNENFADRWHENNNKKARVFFTWVRWVKEDILKVLEDKPEAITDLKAMMNNKKDTSTTRGTQVQNQISGSINTSARSGIDIVNPGKPWSIQ